MSCTSPDSVKVAMMFGPGQMEIREYPFPEVDHDTAIIKVEMCGVCGTDKHIYQGDSSA